jgi:hypothetical protein
MINVNNITSTLAKLPDQALQQYAMMHKNDPYVMSLAVSESNRRKEMRAAQGAQGGMQEQPKVVDAAVAEMAPQAQPMPEDIGIGQLPAGDMEFAGGGILAFANTGSVPGPKDVKERWQDMKRRPDETPTEFLRRVEAAKQKDFQAQGPAKFKQSLEEALKENQRNMQEGMGAALAKLRENEPLIPGLGAYPEGIEREAPVAEGEPTIAQNPFDTQRGAVPAPAPEAAPEAAPVVPAPVVPAPNPLATPVGIAQVAGPTVTNAAPVSMDYVGARAGLAGIKEFGPVTTELDEFEKEKKAAAQKGVDRSKERLTREEKFQAEMGEYGVGKEKRLKEREAKLSKDEKSNYGLAFLEAGLAMMGGKDQNAFANISAGALTGLGSYKTGLAKLNDRKEKLFDAYDSLEDARRSDKKDRFARIETAQDKINSAQTALENVSVDVLGKKVEMNATRQNILNKAIIDTANAEYNARNQAAQADANRATNADVARFNAETQRATTAARIAAGDRRTTAQIESQERIADKPTGQERLFAALADPTSNVAKGMAAYAAAMGKDKDTATADFVRYVEAATKNADPTNPPNMDTLLQQFLAAQQRLGGAKLTNSLPQGAQTVK